MEYCIITSCHSGRDCYWRCRDALEGVYRAKLLLREASKGNSTANVCRCYAGGTHVASFHHSNQDNTNNQFKEEQLFLYIDTGTTDLVGHTCAFTLQCPCRNLTMIHLIVLFTRIHSHKSFFSLYLKSLAVS